MPSSVLLWADQLFYILYMFLIIIIIIYYISLCQAHLNGRLYPKATFAIILQVMPLQVVPKKGFELCRKLIWLP